MTSGNRLRTALMAAVMATGVVGCADADAEPGTPGSVAGEGPARPAAGGDALVVDEQPLEAPVVLDPVPDGLLVTDVSYNRSPGGRGSGACATLYGDPDLADTLDGPVLLVGSSSGSAHGGPSRGGPGEREVDLGDRTGQLIPDGDRTWVAIFGNEYVEFVVGRGIEDDELIEAARGADVDSDSPALATGAVPAGLDALVAGCPGDGPGGNGIGTGIGLQGAALNFGSVSAVRADPRLSALWGFWLEDATGTLMRGLPGSAGLLTGTGGPAGGARARVWAEDGMVLSAVVHGGGDELLDRVVESLRVGTVAEVEALDAEIRNRPPAREEAPCPPGCGFVSGVDDGVRWVFHLQPNPVPGMNEWVTCAFDLTALGGGGSTIIPPPVGELAFSGREGIVGGVAPPGTARVTVTTPGGSTVEARLADEGPRPGELVWGAFVPPGPPAPLGPPPSTATAYDATGAVLATKAG